MHISYVGEDGIDDSGLTRDWYQNLSSEVFNAKHKLFAPQFKPTIYQPANSTKFTKDVEAQFKFVGRFFGKVLPLSYLI
jgi:E3 ubiquitin-protein ligase HUWE1